MRSALVLATLALGAMHSTAGASEQEAEGCLRTRVWDGYADGWGIRTMTSTTLKAGRTKNYMVTLYKGNSYRVELCGDDSVKNVDVLLYDGDGNVIVRDESITSTPKVEFKPPKTNSYYVVVYQREVVGAEEGSVAMAVVYK